MDFCRFFLIHVISLCVFMIVFQLQLLYKIVLFQDCETTRVCGHVSVVTFQDVKTHASPDQTDGRTDMHSVAQWTQTQLESCGGPQAGPSWLHVVPLDHVTLTLLGSICQCDAWLPWCARPCFI